MTKSREGQRILFQLERLHGKLVASGQHGVPAKPLFGIGSNRTEWEEGALILVLPG